MSDERRTPADLDPDDVVLLTRNGVRRTGGERQFHTGECQSVKRAERVFPVTKPELERRPGTYVECANSRCGDTKAAADHSRTGLIERLEKTKPETAGGGRYE